MNSKTKTNVASNRVRFLLFQIIGVAILGFFAAYAQTFSALHTFGFTVIRQNLFTNSDDGYPSQGVLVYGSGLYGITTIGGTNGMGTVFSILTLANNSPLNIASAGVSGTNLLIDCNNRVPNTTHIVLVTTSLALPVNQLVSIATKVLTSFGNFTVTNT